MPNTHFHSGQNVASVALGGTFSICGGHVLSKNGQGQVTFTKARQALLAHR